MKPDWKDAPEWANYLAMDEDGEWFWFANKPKKETYSWNSIGLCESADSEYDWKKTLEKRPE